MLTEERPKVSVVKTISELYKNEFQPNQSLKFSENVRIKPIIKDNNFKFCYEVEGITINSIDKIYIKTVSGNSSFVDYLVFKQEDEPKEDFVSDIPIMAIEETKTSDNESRNTGVYQRATKFMLVSHYYKNTKMYMLYNDELNDNPYKTPSDTSIFGTNLLLTLGVKIVGKNIDQFKSFTSIAEVIEAKNSMRLPPKGNVPILIKKYPDKITISGRLSKPANAGNIGHDPNIGALSLISSVIRKLGWKKRIVIEQHGVSQNTVTKHSNNKFLLICNLLNLELEGITIDKNIRFPKQYWHYEKSSEKVASILLHLLCLYSGIDGIYQNHAGCERGYFKTKNGNLVTIPKLDRFNNKLYIPDLILYNKMTNEVLLIEGKRYLTIKNGLEELSLYNSIEDEFIKKYYPECSVYRYLSIFGDNLKSLPDKKVCFYLADNGYIIVNDDSQKWLKTIIDNVNEITQ